MACLLQCQVAAKQSKQFLHQIPQDVHGACPDSGQCRSRLTLAKLLEVAVIIKSAMLPFHLNRSITIPIVPQISAIHAVNSSCGRVYVREKRTVIYGLKKQYWWS